MKNEFDDDLLLDRFDVSLIAALQQDASATHQALAERIHLSASQVGRRIARLQATGLIDRYVALANPTLLGLGVTALCYVTLSRHGTAEGEHFEQDVAGIEAVLECYAVTGESDYILKLVAADLHELAESVLKPLMRLPGVASVRSNIVLKRVKVSTALPLHHLSRQGTGNRQARLMDR